MQYLDDYQNSPQSLLIKKNYRENTNLKYLANHFLNEDDAIEQLKDFEALLIMRERTKITENLINNLKKLKIY